MRAFFVLVAAAVLLGAVAGYATTGTGPCADQTFRLCKRNPVNGNLRCTNLYVLPVPTLYPSAQ